jgi:hypothetical protein
MQALMPGFSDVATLVRWAWGEQELVDAPEIEADAARKAPAQIAKGATKLDLGTRFESWPVASFQTVLKQVHPDHSFSSSGSKRASCHSLKRFTQY